MTDLSTPPGANITTNTYVITSHMTNTGRDDLKLSDKLSVCMTDCDEQESGNSGLTLLSLVFVVCGFFIVFVC